MSSINLSVYWSWRSSAQCPSESRSYFQRTTGREERVRLDLQAMEPHHFPTVKETPQGQLTKKKQIKTHNFYFLSIKRRKG